MRTVLLSRQAVAVAAVAGLGVLGMSAPAIASAAARHTAARTASHPAATRSLARPALPAGEHYACPPAPVGQMMCMSIIKTAAGSAFAALAPGSAAPAANGFYRPTDLRKAYKLTSAASRGAGRTVAIVDAFSDPHANADLKFYRSHLGLPACTTSSHCLRILNEHGKSKPLPRADAGWALEESLDLDMVSAICPKCHILLIEATNPSDINLGKAEDTAIARGAKYVSNSWGNVGVRRGEHLQPFLQPPRPRDRLRVRRPGLRLHLPGVTAVRHLGGRDLAAALGQRPRLDRVGVGNERQQPARRHRLWLLGVRGQAVLAAR